MALLKELLTKNLYKNICLSDDNTRPFDIDFVNRLQSFYRQIEFQEQKITIFDYVVILVFLDAIVSIDGYISLFDFKRQMLRIMLSILKNTYSDVAEVLASLNLDDYVNSIFAVEQESDKNIFVSLDKLSETLNVDFGDPSLEKIQECLNIVYGDLTKIEENLLLLEEI